MKTWFIEISDNEDLKVTIYADGSVYGKERGKRLDTLTSNAMEEIKYFINHNLGEFRKLGYYNFNNNPFTIKVNDLKKHNRYKFMGWPETLNIIDVLLRNYYQRNLSNCTTGLVSFK